MQKIIYRASERGHVNHGWLNAYHSFSFANYYDPSRVHFGLLRVLNDDTVAPGMGFGMHPHDNMEIVTIPTKGALEHKDNMGNSSVIKPGEVQIMSAGTGVMHSEFNPSKTEEVKLFQVWVFPKEKNIKPRYDQKMFEVKERKNKFQTVVSPEKSTDSLWVNQDVYFSLGNFGKGTSAEYQIKNKTNGVYLMVIEGSMEVEGEELERRDAIGISEINKFKISAVSDTEILVIDVPMN